MLEELRLSLPKRPTPEALTSAARQFKDQGMCWIERALPLGLVEQCREAALSRLDECLDRIVAERGAPLPVGTDNGYAEIVHRAPGRYDLLHGADQAPFNAPAIHADPRWMGLVRALLGPEASLVYSGLLVTLGGAKEQAWHADGEHLFGAAAEALPPHCLNIFFPLVDLRRENGATQLCPGSHKLTAKLPDAHKQSPTLLDRIFELTGQRLVSPVTLEIPAGSAVLFDYRIVHRALASYSDEPRPILYLTFARPWFQDVRNFPTQRLFPEPRNA